jgi:hypothetical protein
MQFHFSDANFSAIAFPNPEVAPVISMILFIPKKLSCNLLAEGHKKRAGGQLFFKIIIVLKAEQ